MSMFIELFSEDVDIHGDGEETEAKFNVVGWPFNLDLSEHAEATIAATLVEQPEVEGGPELLTQLECEQEGSFITIRFPEPIPGGTSQTVRLRAKVFV